MSSLVWLTIVLLVAVMGFYAIVIALFGLMAALSLSQKVWNSAKELPLWIGIIASIAFPPFLITMLVGWIYTEIDELYGLSDENTPPEHDQ